MTGERMSYRVERLLQEASVVGKTLQDVVFYGDDPFFTKENIRAVYNNAVAPYEVFADRIRINDIPEDLEVARGRANGGTKYALLFSDGTAVLFFLMGKVLSIETVQAGRLIPPAKANNIDEHRLFAPVLGLTLTRYEVSDCLIEENPELKIWLHLGEELRLFMSDEGIYITRKYNCPIAISFRELLEMVRDHETLFDDELVLRDRDTLVARIMRGERQNDNSAASRLVRKLLEMNCDPRTAEAILECLETDREREKLIENANDELCPRNIGDLVNEAFGMKKAREAGREWMEGMLF